MFPTKNLIPNSLGSFERHYSISTTAFLIACWKPHVRGQTAKTSSTSCGHFGRWTVGLTSRSAKHGWNESFQMRRTWRGSIPSTSFFPPYSTPKRSRMKRKRRDQESERPILKLQSTAPANDLPTLLLAGSRTLDFVSLEDRRRQFWLAISIQPVSSGSQGRTCFAAIPAE